MTTSIERLREDLLAEQLALDDVVADISEEQWLLATPSPGWSVADQIAHLTYFDEAAASAIADTERFRAERDALIAHASDIDQYTLAPLRQLTPRELFERWRLACLALHEVSEDLADDARVEWFGPSMGARSFLSARLMETWAHGNDVVDALGVTRPPTDRLAHVAQLGYNTRRWSYQVRGEAVPEGEVRLELTSPSGALWTWGPDDADDTVRGPAVEFCLVVTQRRHLEDTPLVAGELATNWLQRAQAFAGAATLGPVKSTS
jgi:uncharacterized protein (TIGR03084 family)